MKDYVPAGLADYVERIVRQLPADGDRKRRIEQELLGHVLAVYDEEFFRTGDEKSAIDSAKRRFGIAADLAQQLEASFPLWERVLFHCAFRKGATMWRFCLLVGCVAILVGMGFVLPAVAKLRDQGHLIAMETAFLAIGVSLTMGGIGSLGYAMKVFRARSC